MKNGTCENIIILYIGERYAMVQSWNGMADSYVIIYYLSSDYLLA
jgi:hypothetical protein